MMLQVLERPRAATFASMPTYYVYLLDDRGRIYERRELTCAGEAEAIAGAETILATAAPCPAAEIWLGPDKIAVVQRHSV